MMYTGVSSPSQALVSVPLKKENRKVIRKKGLR